METLLDFDRALGFYQPGNASESNRCAVGGCNDTFSSSLPGINEGFYPTDRGYLSRDGRYLYCPADEEWTYFPSGPGECNATQGHDVGDAWTSPPHPDRISTYSTLRFPVCSSATSAASPCYREQVNEEPNADLSTSAVVQQEEGLDRVEDSSHDGSDHVTGDVASSDHDGEFAWLESEEQQLYGTQSVALDCLSRVSQRKGYFLALSANVGFNVTDP
ncbi:hypothetical protein C8Q76DRAFT_691963 [Earliella scabrosa]|nr:hypothetical protein C8Q76DRAFT_691963 [Earliella scabrosa]